MPNQDAKLVALKEVIRDILNGLYALRDHAQDECGPNAGQVEQRLINIGIQGLKDADKESES